MRVTALILGILGGLLGLGAAMAIYILGNFTFGLGIRAGGIFSVLGILALVCCGMGIIGGILSLNKPEIGGALLLISGIGGFFVTGIFWFVSGLMLIIGGALALAGRNSRPAIQGGYYGQPYQMPPGYYPPQAPYPQQPPVFTQGPYPQQPPAYPQEQYYPQPNYYPPPGSQPGYNTGPYQQPGYYNQPNPGPGFPPPPSQDNGPKTYGDR